HAGRHLKHTSPSPAHRKRARILRRLALQVARQRGFRLRRRIAIRTFRQSDLLAYRERRLTQLLGTAPRGAVDDAILTRLGLLPKKTTYRAALRQALTTPVAVFYDRSARVLFIRPGFSLTSLPKTRRGALVHEICRALQDQNLPLTRFSRAFPKNSDRVLARRALVAGDCDGVMLENALRPTGADLGSAAVAVKGLLANNPLRRPRALRRAPSFIRRTLLFPHEAGLRMLQTIHRFGGWRRVTALYRRPPETTEQILHPLELRRHKRPRRVRGATLKTLKATWRRVKVDTLGELQIAAILATQVDTTIASRAAAGWGGDRLVAYIPKPPVARLKDQGRKRKGKRRHAKRRANAKPALPAQIPPPLLIHLSVWDSDADALEQEDAQRRWLRARFGPATADLSGTHVYTIGKTQERASIQRRRRAVLLILGSPSILREALEKEVWSRWRVNGRRLPPLRRPR
ncbi:MAG: hypothetical protein KAI47_18265, partial [Deltaproteobacteria bacterium]|nr:hypothetical protein [Deltaproteobacteria bacterium]